MRRSTCPCAARGLPIGRLSPQCGATPQKRTLNKFRRSEKAENAGPRETGVTWCSFGITKRSESKSQVRHYETEDGQGMSRVLTLETLTVPASFFGPACEDMALKLKAGLHISQNREPLWHANIALVQAGDVITPPASSAPGVPDDLRWSGRADLTLTFRRGPSSPQGKAAEGTVAITHAEQPDCGIRGN